MPSYRIKSLSERYNEKLLEPTDITLEENKQIMKTLNLFQ